MTLLVSDEPVMLTLRRPMRPVALAVALAAWPAAAQASVTYTEAITLSRHAMSLVGADHPVVLDTLAAAYASDDRFDQAIETARQAADRARATPGFESRAAPIEQRVGLYLAFQPVPDAGMNGLPQDAHLE